MAAAPAPNPAANSASGASPLVRWAGAFSDVVEKAKRDIVVVANYLAAKMFGRPAYDRHLAMFGASLGLNPSAPILSAAVV